MMVMVGMILSLSSFFVAGDSDKIISALNQGNAGQFSAYFDNFLDIFPDQLFIGRIAQQIRRMKGRHELDAMIMMPRAAELGDRNLALHQRLHREFA